MGQPIAVRNDYTSPELRGLAKRSRNAAQARRLLSIAAVVKSVSRVAAADEYGLTMMTSLQTQPAP